MEPSPIAHDFFGLVYERTQLSDNFLGTISFS
jgi:hypothetical protein